MKFYDAPFEKAGLTACQIQQIRSLVFTWIHSCGAEWTVSRLKDLKNIFINRMAGRVIEVPWIATDNQGIPKGPFKPLFLKGKKRARKCLDALMCYTGVRVPKVTKRQLTKFVESVTAEPLRKQWYLPEFKEAVSEIQSFAKHVKFRRCTYRDYPFSGNKRTMGRLGRSCPNLPERLGEDFETSILWDLLDDDACQQVIADSMDDLYPTLFRMEEREDNPCVGRISVIQERGAKARFIAVPRLSLQISLMSLGRYLFKICKAIPWDCTHDQESGALWAKSSLDQGKRLWSVDLRDFTNYWPLPVIYRTLGWLPEVPVQDLELFHKVATGVWHIPLMDCKENRNAISRSSCAISRLCRVSLTSSGKCQTITTARWSRGQPLGVYPSFPAAAISHGAVLRAIERRFGLEDTFRVLGDDIIINNAAVHWGYRRFLDQLSIPVSQDKTMEDSTVGEFAGFVITQKGKWRPRKTLIPSPNNLLIRLGYEGGAQHRPLDFIAYALQKVYGENSDGLPLSERARLFIQLFRCHDDVRTYANLRRSYYWRILQQCETPIKTAVVSRAESDEVLAELMTTFSQTCPIATKLATSARRELEAAKCTYERILQSFEEHGVLLREIEVPSNVQIMDTAWVLKSLEEEVMSWRNLHSQVGEVLGNKELSAFKKQVITYQMQNAIRSIHRVDHDIQDAYIKLLYGNRP